MLYVILLFGTNIIKAYIIILKLRCFSIEHIIHVKEVKIMNWFRKFMYGRYGVDELSMVLVGVSIALLLLSSLLPRSLSILSLIAYIPMVIYIFRIFSKNIFKRQQENYKYISFKNSMLSKAKKYKGKIQGAKTHKYFKCPSCGQELRVPKGNGKITITCPKCKTSFKAKS